MNTEKKIRKVFASWWNGEGPAPSATSKLSGGASSGSGGSSGGATPWGAVANAAASVINNTVNNLFQNKVYKSQADLLKAQAAEVEMKTRLALLSDDQKYVLAQQLQQSNDDNAKEKLLNDTVVAITVAQLNSTAYDPNEIYVAGLQSGSVNMSGATSAATTTAAGNQIKLAIILIAASVIVVTGAIIYKSHNN